MATSRSNWFEKDSLQKDVETAVFLVLGAAFVIFQ